MDPPTISARLREGIRERASGDLAARKNRYIVPTTAGETPWL
jgi:hypothetical protein